MQDIEDEDKVDDELHAKSASDNNAETNAKSPTSPDHLKSLTLPMKLDVKNMEWDELDELLQVLFSFCRNIAFE